MKKTIILFLIIFISTQYINGLNTKKKTATIPYAFYNPTLGYCAGLYLGLEKLWKDEEFKIGFVAADSKSYFGYILCREIYVNKKTTFEPDIVFGHFQDLKTYLSGNPHFPNERSGSNNSSADNFLETKGDDLWLELNLKYLLKKIHQTHYILGVTPFYRKISLSINEYNQSLTNISNGLKFTVLRENKTYKELDPKEGSRIRLSAIFDFGVFSSNNKWQNIEMQLNRYITINKNKETPLILALNFWSSYCLSWNKKGNGHYQRPPYFYGANLGGRFRLRSYLEGRFHDRAAVLYSTELRKIIKFNPFKKWNFLQRHNIDINYLQLTFFAEAGRVSEKIKRDMFISNLKWDIGVGLRFLMNKNTLIRADFGYSKEGSLIQMYIEQAF